MNRCSWCGKQQSLFNGLTQNGYCISCENEIRDNIKRRKRDMALLFEEVQRCRRPCEKKRLLAMLDQTYTGLKEYKDRRVPFFKSDIEKQREVILSAIEAISDSPTVARDCTHPEVEAVAEDNFEKVFQSVKVIGSVQKSIILEQNIVRIIRDESLTGSRREKAIPIKQISGVEVKEPGLFVQGFIQIQTAGQNVSSSAFTYMGGAFGAVADENSVLFTRNEDYKAAMQIKEYIENYQDPHTIIVANTTTASPALSVADELVKLKGLLDAKIITPSEFERQKTKLLD